MGSLAKGLTKALKSSLLGVEKATAKAIVSAPVPVRYKKLVLGTEGKVTTNKTLGEVINKKRNKNSRLRASSEVRGAVVGGTAVGSAAYISSLKKDIKKVPDKKKKDDLVLRLEKIIGKLENKPKKKTKKVKK